MFLSLSLTPFKDDQQSSETAASDSETIFRRPLEEGRGAVVIADGVGRNVRCSRMTCSGPYSMTLA